MTNDNKPNGVLFKHDDGQLCAVLRENDKWNWDRVELIDMNKLNGEFDDISASNPFEFVFFIRENTDITTCDKKSIVDNTSFSKLYKENKLISTIENDYAKQFIV